MGLMTWRDRTSVFDVREICDKDFQALFLTPTNYKVTLFCWCNGLGNDQVNEMQKNLMFTDVGVTQKPGDL